MDSKKYEKLINYIINEDESKAKELFHEIVVEQSRQIYESIMAEEMMGGEVGDLLDEISAEESGMMEDEEMGSEMEMDSEEELEDLDGSGEEEEVFDLEADVEDSDESDEVEDAVVRIEDKLDQLMDEFEDIMGKMGDEESDEDEKVEVDSEEEVEVEDEDEEMMQEAIQLQKVSTQYPHGGDDGDQKRSPVAADSGQAGMDSKPVHFSDGDEKGRPAPQAKDVKDAGSFKNAPGGKAKVDLSSAPKPVTKAKAGNDKSPVAK